MGLFSGNKNTSKAQASKSRSANSGRFNKKALIITASVSAVVALIAIVFAAIFIWYNTPISIDINDYVSSLIIYDDEREEFDEIYVNDIDLDYDYDYDEEDGESAEIYDYYSNQAIGAGLNVYGYDGYASIDEYELINIIDWESLKNDVDKELSHKKKVNGRHLTFSDMFVIDGILFTADKYDSIGNGDTISITSNEYSMNKGGTTLKISHLAKDYMIDGLKTVKAFNPFDYVSLVAHNANGYGTVSCSVDPELYESIPGAEEIYVAYYDDSTIALELDDNIIANIKFYLDSETRYSKNFSNGDTVSIYCYAPIDDLVAQYDLYIVKDSSKYTVEGLGEYVSKSTSISEEDISNFRIYAGNFVSDRYSGNSNYSDITLVSSYIVDLKEKSPSSTFHNELCFVYSYKFSNWYVEEETKYMFVTFKNLIMKDDGAIDFAPEDYFNSSRFGYDSENKALSSKYGDGYNVTRLK